MLKIRAMCNGFPQAPHHMVSDLPVAVLGHFQTPLASQRARPAVLRQQ